MQTQVRITITSKRPNQLAEFCKKNFSDLKLNKAIGGFWCTYEESSQEIEKLVSFYNTYRQQIPLKINLSYREIYTNKEKQSFNLLRVSVPHFQNIEEKIVNVETSNTFIFSTSMDT